MRATASSTGGARWVCLCVSRWVGREARVHDAPHLRAQLLVRPDLAPRQRRQQLRHASAGSGLPVSERAAADQHQVAPISSEGVSRASRTRVVEGLAVGHQGGGGEDAAAVRFHDAFVDVGRETEIVRVDHQLFSGAQNRVSRMVRNFLGLARMSFASDWNSRVAPLSES